MNSNTQLSITQTLYLKQFFGNYFERKQHTQTIFALTNGLTVIQSLITHFEKQIHLHVNQYHQKKQEIDANNFVQEIYNRLSHIFDKIRQEKENEGDRLSSSQKQVTYENGIQDEQLYQMLNKYKSDFKRQKEERMRLQRQIDTLKDSLHNVKVERDRTVQKVNSTEKALEKIKKQNKNLQTNLCTLKQQIQQLQQYKQQSQIKLEEMIELQILHSQIRKKHELLILNFEESEQQRALMEQKFKHLDTVVESKIQLNQAKWTKIIEQKLNNTQIYQKPACRAFKEFIKSFNKENIVNNS